jgi:hypothetical protein
MLALQAAAVTVMLTAQAAQTGRSLLLTKFLKQGK